MTSRRSIRLVQAGLGTVGHAIAQRICGTPSLLNTISAWLLVDCALIKSQSHITCPAYAGGEGTPKVDRARELIDEWAGENAPPVRAVHQRVECVHWRDLLNSLPAAEGTVVAMGLDDWNARMVVCEDLRALSGGADMLTISGGIDRDVASVETYGMRWSDPCPSCGITTLPGSTPCIALTQSGQLLRGDLRREAHAVATSAVRAMRLWMRGDGHAVNSRMHVLFDRDGRRRVTRRGVDAVSGCMGTHLEPEKGALWNSDVLSVA